MIKILSNELYVKQSLEINLFFLRIMKEHSLFLAVAFQPKSQDLISEARNFNSYFNNLLLRTFTLAQGIINISDDAVTNYTLDAERATSFVTGFEIDTNLTNYELALASQQRYNISQSLVENIYALNNDSIIATQAIINYKSKVLDGVLNCQIYTANYPLLIYHIRREAYFFVDLLTKLQNRLEPNQIEEALRRQIFWNQIMSEHAKFIRGFLDPTEEELIKIAANFGNEFSELNKKTVQIYQTPQLFPQITNESLDLTINLQGFQHQGTEGIINCKIKSLIFPLLGDHVIRETNHYLHLLEKIKV